MEGESPTLNGMFINRKDNCFITVNDYKENFLSNPKTHLLKPAKNKLGNISKVILDKRNLMSSVGLKASKTSKIVSLFYLILKIFTLQLLRIFYQNA